MGALDLLITLRQQLALSSTFFKISHVPPFIFASEASCCLTELRPVTNTNIVIGKREPSSGSITIILPTSRPPLEVDQGKSGSNSDHNVVIFSPRTNAQFKKDRIKTTIKHRPLPQSKIQDFGQELVPHSWIEVIETEDGHQKAFNFHTTLMTFLNKHFPENLSKCPPLTRTGCIQI